MVDVSEEEGFALAVGWIRDIATEYPSVDIEEAQSRYGILLQRAPDGEDGDGWFARAAVEEVFVELEFNSR